MRRQTVIVATRSVRSPAYCFTLPFAHQALMPINVVATAGSNRYADDHGHCMASRCIVPKHIPVTWWPKTDSVSPQLGWLEKATDDALPSRHEQLAGWPRHVHSSIPVAVTLTPFNRVQTHEMFKHLNHTQPNRRL